MNFSDIAGYKKEKECLKEISFILSRYNELQSMGIRLPHGILISGEPGVGKTMMAEALIEDAGMPCIRVTAEDIFTQDGVSDCLRKKFSEAAECAPSILLMDELDKMVGEHSGYGATYNMEYTCKLLQAINDYGKSGILIIAIVNDMDMLCGALKRSGRFDRIIELPLPDLEDRIAIIKHYLKGKSTSKKLNINFLGRITSGMTGADIECVVNEAGVNAIINKSKIIRQKDIDTAIDRKLFSGVTRENRYDDEQRRIIAVHEVGHLITGLVLHPEEVNTVSILPQGNSEGHTEFADICDRLHTKDYVIEMITISLGGMACERLLYPDRTFLSAASDIRNSAKYCRHLLMIDGAFGFGYLQCLDIGYMRDGMSEWRKKEVEGKLASIFDGCLKSAMSILEGHRPLIERYVDILTEQYTMSRDEIMKVYNDYNSERVGSNSEAPDKNDVIIDA